MSDFKEQVFDREKYTELLAEHQPSVINTKEQYEKTENYLKSLLSKARTPEEDKLTDLLQRLTEDYRKNQAALLAQVISAREVIHRAYTNLAELDFLKVLPPGRPRGQQ